MCLCSLKYKAVICFLLLLTSGNTYVLEQQLAQPAVQHTEHTLKCQLRELIGNNPVPDLNSKKWVSVLTETIIAYSHAKSEKDLGMIDRTFRGILAGKYASNILLLESIRRELEKEGVSATEVDRRVRELFEGIISQVALSFSCSENKQSLLHRLGALSSNNILPPPTLQGIRDKIRSQLREHKLRLFDPRGQEVTDCDEAETILQQVNVAVGIPSYKEGNDICNSVQKAFSGLVEYFSREKVVLLGNFYHDVPGNTALAFENEMLRLVSEHKGTNVYSLVMSTGFDENKKPVTGKGNNFRNFFELLWFASSQGSLKGAATVDADLKTVVNKGKEEGISKLWIKHLLYPIVYPNEFGLEQAAQFVSPFYARHEYDGGMTNNCCIGFVKLVSDTMVRQPIGGDFGLSAAAIEKFLFDMEWNGPTRQYGIDISMSLTAALNQLRVVEVDLGVKIHDSSEGKAFRIGSEVLETVVRFLANTKERWIAAGEGRKVVRVGPGQEALPRGLDVDYEAYKEEFYEFLGDPYQKSSLKKDLLTKEQILGRAKEWGLDPTRIEFLFDGCSSRRVIETTIRPYVMDRLEQLLDTEENRQVHASWVRLFQGSTSSFLENVAILYKLAGFDVTKKTLDVLIGIGIDVSNPWLATRYFLEVIIWGEMLIGHNIQHLKYFFVNHEQHPLNVQFSFQPITVPDLNENMSLATLREKYEEVLEKLPQVILSKADYRDIDREVRRSINLFYKRLVHALVKRIWRQVGIPEEKEAVCYFREAKTFVSDLDLIYVGPDQDRVDRQLTSAMFSIGIKRDIFAIDMILADAMNRDSSNFIGGQYYRNIEVVAFNIDFSKFFKDHFEKNDLSFFVNINNFKANNVFAKWQTTPFQEADTKEMYYVGVNHLLRGLALKYSIAWGRYAEGFWEELSHYLKPEEVCILSDANATANQIRNLYQLYIARRSWVLFVRTDEEWHNIKAQVAKNIEEVLSKQGIPHLRNHLAILRDQLNDIREAYLGKPRENTVLVGEDLPEIKSDYWYALNRRVNNEYLLMSSVRFGYPP